jgi:hypothetical protein
MLRLSGSLNSLGSGYPGWHEGERLDEGVGLARMVYRDLLWSECLTRGD